MRNIALFCALVLSSIVHAQTPVELVYPHLDAANSRWFFFSSASRPFGMVNLSPDTEIGGAWGSGYRYNTEEIKGFSHIHAWQLAGVSVMPVTKDKLDKNTIKSTAKDYYSAFSHDKEIAKPGYHKVFLERYHTTVELTSTKRVGLHRVHFPDSTTNAVVVNLGGKLGPSEIKHGELKQVSDNELSGMILNGKTIRRPKHTPVYFCMQFNTNIKGLHSFKKENVSQIEGKNKGAIVELNTNGQPVLMKVGISYVSAEQARLNIQEELAHWDFEQVKQEAFNEWNSWLNKIKVTSSNTEAVRRFYTDLWHALQGRRTISDANGQYADRTGPGHRTGQIPLDSEGKPKFNHYNSDSFWGAQWTISTLWHLAYPEVSSDFCNSLLTYYKDGGLIPRGPSGGNYTYVMTGASATPFIVSAYQKGIRDFDIDLAYEGMKKNHMPGGIMERSGYEHRNSKSGGLELYMEQGYVPYPYKRLVKAFHKKGAGQTLEYAYQDWTLAQLAKALGNHKDSKYFENRSHNYKHLYNPQTGYMHPKRKNGKWLKDYTPADYVKGFVESNGYQGTWYVPHDYAGLAALMGGKDSLIHKLNSNFEQASKQGFTSGKKHADEEHEDYKRTPINYGNQPSIHTAFIFSDVGAPWLTQKWSRAVVDSVYSGLSPHYGYNGDEDQGLMGSLAVLMKIGLFQVNGGTEMDSVYQIGSPLFDKVEIDLSSVYYSGKTFTIETVNNSKDNIYIESATYNGVALEALRLRHSEIVKGGTLKLVMSKTPNKNLK